MSLWDKGELIVAQGRKRLNWAFNDRTLSGVTGITGTGVTVSDPLVDKIAQKAILSVDSKPHGVWSVDMTYDSKGMPNPTEINIGRFFTTSLFFTKLGLNMPYVYLKLAFGEELPEIKKKINPLPPDYAWIRGMDTEPVLTNMKKISEYENDLKKRRSLYI
jgi:carbamoyl-phosphate synthase large subunit